jgi:DNA-directed RNA polymerase subunit RPC12/RpoP
MSAVKQFKVECKECGQHIEGEMDGFERLIQCPTCSAYLVARPTGPHLPGWFTASKSSACLMARPTEPQPTPSATAPPKSTNENPEYLECPCKYCGQNLEFPADGVGTDIECPTCHQKTMLHRPLARTTEPPKSPSPMPYIRCPCLHCGNQIIFPESSIGDTVGCPHCGKQTMLHRPMAGAPEPASSPSPTVPTKGNRESWRATRPPKAAYIIDLAKPPSPMEVAQDDVSVSSHAEKNNAGGNDCLSGCLTLIAICVVLGFTIRGCEKLFGIKDAADDYYPNAGELQWQKQIREGVEAANPGYKMSPEEERELNNAANQAEKMYGDPKNP